MSEPLPVLEEKFIIPSYFVDDNAQLTVTSLFQLIQEMSDRHATILGAGWQQLRHRGFFWVITKIKLIINRLPSWQEPVLLRTWVKKSEAATSPRDFEMEDAEGNILVAASTIWAILDKEQSRPQRMDMFDSLFMPQERSAIDRKPPKIGPIQLSEVLPEPKSVLHSDIDMNHHVNNAHYIQWAFDSVRDDFRKSHKISSVVVNFIAQAKPGDRYRVCTEHLADENYKTAIFSEDMQTEFCRLQTEWKSIM
jgi:acyl-ACP thioesterase